MSPALSRSTCTSHSAKKSATIADATPGLQAGGTGWDPISTYHREIESVAALLPAGTEISRFPRWRQPNAIAPTDFVRLIDALTIHFGLTDPVYSIELDPRTMTRNWAEALHLVGVERASLGLQTFAKHCQERIGRVQSEDMILQTTDWLREAGVTSLNYDLMYGLPGQTSDDLHDSLSRTRVLGADRIALFGYAHVPHIVPRQRAIDATGLPDQAQRFAMAAEGYAYLVTHGYTPVGFDHFAIPGKDALAARPFRVN